MGWKSHRNSLEITEPIPYPAVDGGSCLHQEVDTGLQLFALALKVFLLLLCQCLATLLPEQRVVGQNSTVEWGMTWKGKDGKEIATVPARLLITERERGRAEECMRYGIGVGKAQALLWFQRYRTGCTDPLWDTPAYAQTRWYVVSPVKPSAPLNSVAMTLPQAVSEASLASQPTTRYQ